MTSAARRGGVDGEVPPRPPVAVGDERGGRGGDEVEEGVAEGDTPREETARGQNGKKKYANDHLERPMLNVQTV